MLVVLDHAGTNDILLGPAFIDRHLDVFLHRM
jgi:hypothetical protein